MRRSHCKCHSRTRHHLCYCVVNVSGIDPHRRIWIQFIRSGCKTKRLVEIDHMQTFYYGNCVPNAACMWRRERIPFRIGKVFSHFVRIGTISIYSSFSRIFSFHLYAKTINRLRSVIWSGTINRQFEELIPTQTRTHEWRRQHGEKCM